MLCVCFALCHLPVGRVGRVRRVGHLIFKKEMPESFAQGRCLDDIMRNSMRKASSGYFAFCKAHREGQRPRCPIRRCTGNEDVAPPVWLNPARSSLQMVWLNPAQSSQSQFQETIVPRVIRVPHVPPRYQQVAKHKASHCSLQVAKLCEMGLCAPCRGAPAVVLQFSCQRSNWLIPLPLSKCEAHLQSERSL